MAIEAVLFDLDDTLILDECVTREAFLETARVACRHFGTEERQFVRSAGEVSEALWKKSPCHAYCTSIGIIHHECLWGNLSGDGEEMQALRAWASGFRHDLFDALLREQGISDEAGPEMLAGTFSESRRRFQRLMPDARETLVRLKGTFRLGLLTNGAPALQREKLHASGLAAFFDAVVVSGEFGRGKPDPAIFHHTLDLLGCAPSAAAMVGNSLERDIAGAKNAGLSTAVWIQVPGSEEPAAVQPDLTIRGLHELPAIFSGV